MKARLVLVVFALTATLGLSRCDWMQAEPQSVGHLVQAWSESHHDMTSMRDWLPEGFRVVHNATERDRFISHLPGDIPTHAVPTVDPDRNLLVVGVYGNCHRSGLVVIDDDLRGVDFTVSSPEPLPNCVWAPYTVEVWRVPLDALPHR